uniref:Putative ixoderin b n=1 Tax=Ixodes ricinus TaxID=34613 RepID=A0A6B0UWC9_IXORI
MRNGAVLFADRWRRCVSIGAKPFSFFTFSSAGNRTISCSQIKMRERSSALPKYKINPLGTLVDAACDMETDGGGWTVIQRRTEYEAYDNNFEKKKRDYERGFTTQGGALWIGSFEVPCPEGCAWNVSGVFHARRVDCGEGSTGIRHRILLLFNAK